MFYHAGECCLLHHKETLVAALYQAGEVEVWSTSREEGTLEDPRMLPWRRRLDHHGTDAEEEAWMEARDSATRRNEVLDPLVLVEPSRRHNGVKQTFT